MTVDWDDAFDNFGHIDGAADYPGRWRAEAQSCRLEMARNGRARLGIPYGSGDREAFDLFFPDCEPRGLVIFAHGGFWKAFDRSTWSHLATGAISNGYAFCIPGYPLAPDARVSRITQSFAKAAGAVAGLVDGPVSLAGHSAGGHLVTRMISKDTALPAAITTRITRVISISGVHDLRPLLATGMNDILQLTGQEAAAESAVLNQPLDIPLTCWVGSDERPEFIRQNDLLVEVWGKREISIDSVHAAGKHHFNVIDDLIAGHSRLTKLLTGLAP